MKKPTLIFKLKSFPEKSETFIVSNIVEAINAGFEIVILCNEKKGLNSTSQPFLIKKYQLLEKSIQFHQPSIADKRYFKALRLALNPSYLYYFLRLIWLTKRLSLSYLFQLQYYSNYRKAVTLHLHFPTHPNLVYQLKKIGYLRINLVSTFHGYDIHYNSTEECLALKKELRLIYSTSNAITVNTKFLYNKLTELGGPYKNLKIVPMGVDIGYFNGDQKNLPKNKEIIRLLSIGRLVEFKGHEYAIRAVERLVKSNYKITYTIVGAGPLHQYLIDLIKELKLDNNVILSGSKTQDEIRELFKVHHIFLMCSVTDKSGRAESQGVVTLEAQAMGLPVIAFNSGGVAYTIIDNFTGYLIKEMSIDNYSKAIIKLMENEELYNTFSKNALKFVKDNYNLQHTGDQFLKLYDEKVY